MLGRLIRKAHLSFAIVVLLAATTTVAYNLSSVKIQSNDVSEDPTTKLLLRGCFKKLKEISANISSLDAAIVDRCVDVIDVEVDAMQLKARVTVLEEELQTLQKELNDHRTLVGHYVQYDDNIVYINYYMSLVSSLKIKIHRNEHSQASCEDIDKLAAVQRNLQEFTNKTHFSPNDYIMMITHIETAINLPTFDQNRFGNIVHSRDVLETLLIANAAGIFKMAMIFDVYANDDQIVKLADALFQFKPSVSDEVMHRAIDGVYGKIRKRKIADNMWSNPHIPQIADGLVYTYQKIKSTHSEDDLATLKVAQYLSHLQKSANYSSEMTEHGVDQVNLAIQSMPRSVINLYFSENRCLKTFDHATSTTDSGFRWFIENELGSEVFYVRNHAKPKEYLYADQAEHSKNYHYVTTVYAPDVRPNESTWNVEIDGEKLLIRSIVKNEYLCDISEEVPNTRLHTFGLMTGGISLSNCEWKLESCD